METLLEQVNALDIPTRRTLLQKVFESMPLGEVIEFVPHMEKEWDVEAKPDYGQANLPPEEEEEAVQTEFDVIVTALGMSRMPIVKSVRAATERSLKESSDLLKNLPATVMEKVSKDKAEETRRELEGLGATVEVK